MKPTARRRSPVAPGVPSVGAMGGPPGCLVVELGLLQSLPWVAPNRGLVWLSSADAAIPTRSSISSVGIQHQAPGLDPAWTRIWFLDAAAHPVRSCRLEPVSSIEQRESSGAVSAPGSSPSRLSTGSCRPLSWPACAAVRLMRCISHGWGRCIWLMAAPGPGRRRPIRCAGPSWMRRLSTGQRWR
jgi:hypothetical protein